MFDNLLSFWRGKDFLVQVLDEFKTMLNDTRLMFTLVVENLFANEIDDDLEKKIYDIDKNVNALQKDIRKRIVAHLSLRPSVDVTACLLLMSVIKDAERLGDYAKNLYHVRKMTPQPLDRELYEQYFNHYEADITTLFDKTREAFMESNESEAESAWKYEKDIAKKCDRIIEQLVASDISFYDAVRLALTARYYKRTIAHLVNIATSVILPLSELDFFDEKLRPEI